MPVKKSRVARKAATKKARKPRKVAKKKTKTKKSTKSTKTVKKKRVSKRKVKKTKVKTSKSAKKTKATKVSAVVSVKNIDAWEHLTDAHFNKAKTLEIKLEHEFEFDINKKMPNLEKLIIDADVRKLVLNDNTTPKLKVIDLVGGSEHLDFQVKCSKLKELKLQYVLNDGQGIPGPQITACLKAAKNLKVFDAYKTMFDLDCLHFQSKDLEKIQIQRADGLQGIMVYSPKLKLVYLDNDHEINVCEILTKAPGFPKINVHKASKFEVVLPEFVPLEMIDDLLLNPRVKKSSKQDLFELRQEMEASPLHSPGGRPVQFFKI